MARMRFVGGESHIGDASNAHSFRVNTFGQLLDLDAETLHNCILCRVSLLTEEEFDICGFTEDELHAHSEPMQHLGAGDEFNAKKYKAHALAVKRYDDYVKAAAAGDTYMAREEKAAQPVLTQSGRRYGQQSQSTAEPAVESSAE